MSPTYRVQIFGSFHPNSIMFCIIFQMTYHPARRDQRQTIVSPMSDIIHAAICRISGTHVSFPRLTPANHDSLQGLSGECGSVLLKAVIAKNGAIPNQPMNGYSAWLLACLQQLTRGILVVTERPFWRFAIVIVRAGCVRRPSLGRYRIFCRRPDGGRGQCDWTPG